MMPRAPVPMQAFSRRGRAARGNGENFHLWQGVDGVELDRPLRAAHRPVQERRRAGPTQRAGIGRDEGVERLGWALVASRAVDPVVGDHQHPSPAASALQATATAP